MHFAEIRLDWIAGASALALLGSICEGLSLGLLIPTVQGLLERNYAFVKNIAILGLPLEKYSDFFTNRNSIIFGYLVLLILVAGILKNTFQYLSAVASVYQIRSLADNLRKKIYANYLEFGKLFFDQHSLGSLHQTLTGHTNHIALELQHLQHAFFLFCSLLIYFSLMLLISWQLTLVILLVVPMTHFGLQWLLLKIKKTSELYADSYADMGTKISNALSCIPLIKFYSNEKEEREGFGKLSGKVKDLQFSIDKKQILIPVLSEITILLMTLLIVVMIAFFAIKKGSGQMAGFMVFFVLLRRTMGAFSDFNRLQASFASVSGPIREIAKIFNKDEKYFVPNGRLIFSGLRKWIEIKNLTFSYPNGNAVLKNVSCHFDKGQVTAITGASGSGKTTLINLLIGFYEFPRGAIYLDSTDMRDLDMMSVRNRMALVSQDAQLFSASLRSNLTYGLNAGLSDEELLSAVRKARLNDLLEKLPQGLETPIGERGVMLSGGEKQRVAIARALLKKAEILILDEATSALDSLSEKLIQEAIHEALRGRTAIVIAHRLSTIKDADKVIVLEDGQMIEEGKPDYLLTQSSNFRRLWENQQI